MKGSNPVEERAAQWLLRRESGPWSGQEQTELDAWFAQSTVHRIAYLRLEAGWEQANRLKALGAGFPRGKVPTIAELDAGQQVGLPPFADVQRVPARETTRTSSWRWAAAAAVLLLTGAGIFLHSSGFLNQDRYVTTVGAVTSVPLRDGTNVTLNTASKMSVVITDSVRKVELARGEAFFDVAKDSSRPFVVQAGDRTITVLGTKFSVRHDGDDIRVIVTEGKVAVSPPGSSGKTAATGALILTAGETARTVDSRLHVQKGSVAHAEQNLSWRSGYLVLQETTLADAVAEFNRYNERKIVIADSTVGTIRLTGKFRSTNCETFVRLLQDSFQIQARLGEDRIVLTRR